MPIILLSSPFSCCERHLQSPGQFIAAHAPYAIPKSCKPSCWLASTKSQKHSKAAFRTHEIRKSCHLSWILFSRAHLLNTRRVYVVKSSSLSSFCKAIKMAEPWLTISVCQSPGPSKSLAGASVPWLDWICKRQQTAHAMQPTDFAQMKSGGLKHVLSRDHR